MNKEIPKVYFNKKQRFHIEVVNFTQLFDKLNQLNTHDPFSVHKIEFYLALIITEGTYTHFVDLKPYQLSKGSALFIAKNQVHHFTKDLKNAKGYCIIFDGLFADKSYFISENLKLNRLFNYHIEAPVIHQGKMGKDNFIDIAYKLYEEYRFPNDFAKSEILSSLLHVLLLKAERTKETQSISDVKTHWLQTFNAFKNKLEKNYTATRNARDYASELFISYKFLNDIVKTLTGKTVKAFIDHFVTMEIKRYLMSTALSVKEISHKTGFEEPANMVKFFKKNTRTTPLKFRQAI